MIAAMTFLDSFKKLYSLDTLDSRLVTSSTTPARTSGSSIGDIKPPAQTVLQDGSREKIPGVQASKWNTVEFYFYYLCFLTIPFFMVKSVYDVSKGIVSYLLYLKLSF